MNRERTVEYSRAEARMTAEDLRRYLLALSYNCATRNYCLRQFQYPRELSLNPAWHETFEVMRAQTAATHCEHWTLIGVSEKRDKVLISNEFTRGNSLRIPGEAKAAKITKARAEGISFVVGEIHTHPAWLFPKFTRFQDSYSLDDLYCLLQSPAAPAMQVLVGPTRNVVVFRSHESDAVPYVSQKGFVRFWRRRLVSHELMGGAMDPNRILGKRYALAFYKGKPGEPLSRVFP